jgi:ATP-binding cassette, subfamily F, member 3
LSMAINGFDGTVMLVSHDRALLREVCDEFVLVTRGGVVPFDGDLDDYQRWLLDTSRAVAKGQPLPAVPLFGAAAEAAARDAANAARNVAAPAPAARAVAAPPPAPNASRDDRQQAKKDRLKLTEQSRPLRNDIARIDTRMAKLAQEKATVEATLASGKATAAQFADLGRELAHISAEVAMLEETWLEKTSALEAMNAALV